MKLYRLHALCALLWLVVGVRAMTLPGGVLMEFLVASSVLTAMGQALTGLTDYRRYRTRRVLGAITGNRRL